MMHVCELCYEEPAMTQFDSPITFTLDGWRIVKVGPKCLPGLCESLGIEIPDYLKCFL